MDYQQELKRLQEGGNYWKPNAGQFKVKALTELEETEPFIRNKGKDTEEPPQPQYKLKILVSGEEKTWTFGKGTTMASTHAQLVNVAVHHNNTLKNIEFTVLVKSDGKKRDFSIVL